MERFDVSLIKINHLAFKLSKSGAHGFNGLLAHDLQGVMIVGASV